MKYKYDFKRLKDTFIYFILHTKDIDVSYLYGYLQGINDIFQEQGTISKYTSKKYTKFLKQIFSEEIRYKEYLFSKPKIITVYVTAKKLKERTRRES